jgi:ribosomal protein S25
MRGRVSRKEILNNFASEIDSQSIQIVERTLEERGVMKLVVNNKREIFYQLIEEEGES